MTDNIKNNKNFLLRFFINQLVNLISKFIQYIKITFNHKKL